MNILVLKDNYNSFEQFYIDELNKVSIESFPYYKSNSVFRKISSHLGLPFEYLWFESWKNNLNQYELIIVFDSIHTPFLINYINSHCNAKIIYWHWNPLHKHSDFLIYNKTKKICDHWTFNPYDAEKWNMKLNNQFFFYSKNEKHTKENKAFFVGADKGRYSQLISIASLLEKNEIMPDFHVVDKCRVDRFYQKNYIDYKNVLKCIDNEKYAVELVQENQDGLTSRALEAMFMETKLITNNLSIKKCSFYNKNNIYIIGEDGFEKFIKTSFEKIEKDKIHQYSAQGWIERFLEDLR